MTINELTENLEKSNDYLRRQSKRIVEQIAVQSQLNIKALVQRRIQQTGKDAKGKKFGNYSKQHDRQEKRNPALKAGFLLNQY